MLTKSLHLHPRRPSMLSHPKYRHKEEKRKLLKLSCRKLSKLADPESVLCKAVLINNTLKFLQQNNSASPGVSQTPPPPGPETDLDILNTEIQFPPPLTPMSEENISSENDFFNICYDHLPQSEHHLVLRGDSDTTAATEESEGNSYQDGSSQVYNISSCGSSKTNSLSNCSSSASQALLNLPLHRIVECKV